MAAFVERVHGYPIIHDSCEVMAGVYNRSKSVPQVGYICGVAENLVGTVATQVKHFAESNSVINKVDSLACNYVLDPLESKIVQVKYPSEQIFGPLANYTVEKMEKCADLFLPLEEGKKEESSAQLRLVKLKDRIQSKVLEDSGKIIAEIQHLLAMLTGSVDIKVVKEKLTYILSVLDSRFRSMIHFFNGPVIEENLKYLRGLLAKLLDDLSLENIKETFSYKKLQEVLEKLQSQLLALQQPKKVRPEPLDDSQEIAEVKIVNVDAKKRKQVNVNVNEIQEDQLASNAASLSESSDEEDHSTSSD